MIPSLFSCFLFLFVVLICWKKYKARGPILNLPPGPRKLPIIGNLHQLIGSGPVPQHSLRDLAKKYGPIIHLKLGEVSTVVVSSPKGASEVMKTHDVAFAQRPDVIAAEVFPFAHSGLFACRFTDYYRQIRKICTQELLGAQRNHLFRSIREEEVWNLIQSISSSRGLPINLSEKLLSLTNTSISRAAFGEKCRSQNEYISLVKEMMTICSGFNIADLFPSLTFLGFMSGLKPALKKVYRRIDKILQEIIDDHRLQMMTPGSGKDNQGKEDLIHVLLKLQDSSELKLNITAEHIKGISMDIYIGAGESSATTLEWAMSELMRNPRLMEKAQAEVREVMRGKGKLEETDIQKLDYVKSVIKETLRLHPPVPLLIREAREKCKISGYDIPIKTKVMINLGAIGRDPEFWINADCFQPERFLGSFVDFKGTDFEFIPFGAGRRMCPGLPFGAATVEFALAQLLYHFDWKLPNGIKPEDLDMTEAFGAVCRRRNDLYLIATPRT